MKRLLRNILLAFHDYLIATSFNRKIKATLKIESVHKTKYHPEFKARHNQLWKDLQVHSSSRWVSYYAGVNGIIDERYVPASVYYVDIEPVLNNKRFVAAYNDKNAYDILFHAIRKPKVYIRCINGSIYDADYQHMDDKSFQQIINNLTGISEQGCSLMLKPSVESGRGRAVFKLACKDGQLYDPDGRPMDFEALKAYDCKNFLIQEFVKQHECTAILNPSSLNTIRVFTYRSVSDGAIKPLHYLQKFGSPDSFIDKTFRIGINEKGYYNPFCTGAGKKYVSVNGLELAALKPFPFMEKLKDFAVNVASGCIHSRVVGMDLAIDSSGNIVMIEVNNIGIGVDNLQMHGGPLFHEYTDEVIAYCLSNKKTYSYYFER